MESDSETQNDDDQYQEHDSSKSQKSNYYFTEYILQVTNAANFIRLNAMCFDFWFKLNFRDPTPPSGGFSKKETKKFVKYSIYVWVGSILLSTFIYIMDQVLLNEQRVKNPGQMDAKMMYFHGPIGAILLSNLIMFIHTLMVIAKQRKDLKKSDGSKSNIHMDYTNHKFKMFLKVFIIIFIISIYWLADVIWLLQKREEKPLIVHIIGIGNSLHGILFFVIFVCEKRILLLIKEKFCMKLYTFEEDTAKLTENHPGEIYRRINSSIVDEELSFEKKNINETISTSNV